MPNAQASYLSKDFMNHRNLLGPLKELKTCPHTTPLLCDVAVPLVWDAIYALQTGLDSETAKLRRAIEKS